jgi:hypothetical protein
MTSLVARAQQEPRNRRVRMSKLRSIVVAGIVVALVGVVWSVTMKDLRSQPPAEAYVATGVPEGQTYTGAKRCASCHLKQFMNWKKTKHAKEAWESVAAKYRADPECIKCHTTGYGAATGFKDEASTPNLVGTSCEACHGPGSKHEEIAKKYANKKTLAPEEDKEVRGSTYKILPQNVCIRCHIAQNHKDHPKYDKQ